VVREGNEPGSSEISKPYGQWRQKVKKETFFQNNRQGTGTPPTGKKEIGKRFGVAVGKKGGVGWWSVHRRGHMPTQVPKKYYDKKGRGEKGAVVPGISGLALSQTELREHRKQRRSARQRKTLPGQKKKGNFLPGETGEQISTLSKKGKTVS